MFSWLKRLFSRNKDLKRVDKAIENMPTQHADTSKNLSLDPKNDPFGLS